MQMPQAHGQCRSRGAGGVNVAAGRWRLRRLNRYETTNRMRITGSAVESISALRFLDFTPLLVALLCPRSVPSSFQSVRDEA